MAGRTKAIQIHNMKRDFGGENIVITVAIIKT